MPQEYGKEECVDFICIDFFWFDTCTIAIGTAIVLVAVAVENWR